jgi:chaperonin cofactor prefoldin
MSTDDVSLVVKKPKVEATEQAPKETVSYEEAKELKRRKTQLNNQIKRCEEAIEILEAKLQEMDKEIAQLDYSNEAEANKILATYHHHKQELDELMLNWEKATEELMEID